MPIIAQVELKKCPKNVRGLIKRGHGLGLGDHIPLRLLLHFPAGQDRHRTTPTQKYHGSRTQLHPENSDYVCRESLLRRSALQSFANIARWKVRSDRKEAGIPKSLPVTSLTALHSNFQNFHFLSFRMSALGFVGPIRLFPALANHNFKQTPQKVKLAPRLFLQHLFRWDIIELSQLLLEGVNA